MRRVLFAICGLGLVVSACGSAPTPTAAPTSAAPTASPASGLAASARLTWHREGGVAGFCDVLTATTAGDVQAGRCNDEPATGQLTAEERLQLQTWAVTFADVVIVIGDPATADSLLTTLEMNGLGQGQPAEAEQQAMLDWSQAVYNRLRPPP